VASGSVVISSRNLTGLGAVLVDGQGRTLYVFEPDHAKAVTCLGGCASVWPPVSLPGTTKPTASGQVKAALLTSDPNPGGGRVVTYDGWPLYNYVADPAPGSASGEGVISSGGAWYVISPSGAVIKQQS
jgi:predicted lipoprotein with Yx(FWY)xxD motif